MYKKLGYVLWAVSVLPGCGTRVERTTESSAVPLNPPQFETAGEYIEPTRPKESVNQIRVQIFPHLGAYATPQKAEKQVEAVRFESKGNCTLSRLEDPSDLIAKGQVISLSFEQVAGPLTLECESPATLVREQGLKSYTYSGRFEIRAVSPESGPRYLSVVNVVPFETYLKGVVPSEVFPTWPIETLKAQAVAARTYATVQVINERKKNAKNLETSGNRSSYDVDDTVSYQAYGGIMPNSQLTDQAVEETRGQVILHQGKVIVAYFSADSGGYTESAENVWGRAVPYCRSKPEVYDLALVKSAWTAETTYAAVAEAFKKEWGEAAKVSQIMIAQTLPSGRAKSLLINFENAPSKSIVATQFQYRLKLRSTLFELVHVPAEELQPAKIRIQGRGYGHGVGMNQWGAQALAENMGWNYRQILGFYYDDTVIESL